MARSRHLGGVNYPDILIVHGERHGMAPIHEQLAAGRWQRLSLMEQLANVGSEVGRAARWYGKDQQRCEQPFIRALREGKGVSNHSFTQNPVHRSIKPDSLRAVGAGSSCTSNGS